MSECISSEGEYSDHRFGDAPEFTCDRCWVFDEGEALAEIETLRAKVEAFRCALDPEEFECDRLGLRCISVSPPDRWCRACRLSAALVGLS